jgi:hypothetical protein
MTNRNALFQEDSERGRLFSLPTSPQWQSSSNSNDNRLKGSTIDDYCLKYYPELNMINRARKEI